MKLKKTSFSPLFIPLRISHQRGAVLFVSLIFLVIITLLGITSLRSTQTQEKMVSNNKDLNFAFQNAELALREGERWLRKKLKYTGLPAKRVSSKPPNGATDHHVWSLGTPSSSNNAWWKEKNDAWWQNNAKKLCSKDKDGFVSTVDKGNYGCHETYDNHFYIKRFKDHIESYPRYIIEYHSSFCPKLEVNCKEQDALYYYRITAKGTGSKKDSQGNYNSRVLLQSIFTPD
jgi:type IV pilus assembly protein PilX